MTPKQIIKKRAKLQEVIALHKELGRQLTDDIMAELEKLVKKNNGRIDFRRVVDLHKRGWSIRGYSLIWCDYHGWDKENNCEEHHEQLCLDTKSNRGPLGIPCVSNHPVEDNLFALRHWAESGNKSGILYDIYEEVVNTLGIK